MPRCGRQGGGTNSCMVSVFGVWTCRSCGRERRISRRYQKYGAQADIDGRADGERHAGFLEVLPHAPAGGIAAPAEREQAHVPAAALQLAHQVHYEALGAARLERTDDVHHAHAPTAAMKARVSRAHDEYLAGLGES